MKNKFKLLSTICAISPIIACTSLTSCTETKKYLNQVETNFGGQYAFNYGKISESKNDTHIETCYIRQKDKWVNNPNFCRAVLLKQCIDYKKKHPEKDVEAAVNSFHFSHLLGACVDKTKPDFGKVKEMKNVEEEDNGYIRFSYLIIKAAKAGIKTYCVGQTPAAYEPAIGESGNFEEYFIGHMNDLCDDGIHKVKDYLTFKRCKWTDWGEKPGTDMMHLKNCTVSAYTDSSDVDHDASIYVSSANLDAILDDGTPGQDAYQTAIIVSDHPKLAECFFNYTKLLVQYCEMEDAARFRELVRSMNKEQIDTLTNNPQAEITNQIVYMGSEKDKIFELYLTPFGGSTMEYDTKYNPYSKYLNQFLLADAGCPLWLTWVNANFKSESEFTWTVLKIIDEAFYKNASLKNKLILAFYSMDLSNKFNDLIEGVNIGSKSINRVKIMDGNHAKDLTLHYTKNGQKQYVTIWNTLNFHMGAHYYQSNSLLVIKETEATHNSAYVNLTKFLSDAAINEKDLV